MTTLIIIQSGIAVGISNDGRSLSKILYALLKGQGLDSLRNLVSTGQNTVHPPTTTPPMPPGCQYNGQYYPPNSEINKGEDRQSNWCYGAFCDGQGQVLHWDDFNCFPTTTLPTTTAPTTTPPTTPPPGCYFHGKYYPLGKISRGQDRGSNWCWGYICGEDGHIIAWDNFHCFLTTSTPTTTSPEPTTIAGTKRKRKMNFLSKLFS